MVKPDRRLNEHLIKNLRVALRAKPDFLPGFVRFELPLRVVVLYARQILARVDLRVLRIKELLSGDGRR